MPADNTNKWRVYVGVMTESTLKRNQRWFHIYVPEFMPAVTGDVAPETVTNKIKIENTFTGKNEEIETKVTKTIYADYFGVNSSVSVPTMYKGMQVIVINYGHTDRWYWLPLERDDVLKTFENVRISANDKAVSNKTVVTDPEDIRTKEMEGITDDTTYFMEIDTKYNKRIVLRTSATDGEEYRYGIEIDTVQHTIRLWDEPDVVINEKGKISKKALDLIKDAVRGDKYTVKDEKTGAESDYTFDGHVWALSSSVTSRCNRTSPVSNQIIIESKQPDPRLSQWGKITLQTASGTTVMMNDVDLDIIVPRNLNLVVGGAMTSTIEVAKTEKVTGPVNITHGSTYTHLVQALYSLTVKDCFGLSVLKNMGVVVSGAAEVKIAGAFIMSALSYVLTVVTGLNITANDITTAVTNIFQNTFKALLNKGKVIDHTAEKTYSVKTPACSCPRST